MAQSLCALRCSITKFCPTLCNPMDCSMPGFPVLHCLPSAQTCSNVLTLMSIELVMPSNLLILCRPLLLLPLIFPRIRVFSIESAVLIRWPKYWNFSISPSNEYSGLTSFRIDWLRLNLLTHTKELMGLHSFDLLALQIS